MNKHTAHTANRSAVRAAARTTASAATVAVAATLALGGCTADPIPPTVDRPLVRADDVQSISLGIEDVTDNEQDWDAVRERLDAAHANMVTLASGRVEFVAFDWEAHPEAVADEGTDHLAVAIDELAAGPGDEPRLVDILIDALIPKWISEDPSVGGVAEDGSVSKYTPSATAIHDGPVGDRYLELVEELARRYQPDQITFTELKFDDETFGKDDSALYRQMTGEADWPRRDDGSIDQSAPEIGEWRSQVLADLLDRASAVLDDVAADTGKRTKLGMDTLINWDDPTAGVPDSGLSYPVLVEHADRLVLWGYLGIGNHTPRELEDVLAALERSGMPMEKFIVSVGIWDHGEADGTISPKLMAAGVRAADTHGITSVNVTPYTLMTPEHWSALSEVWTTLPATLPAPSPSEGSP
ncbi:hypothetical protein GCM10010413_32640 [Promicromonospora sukumoe]|uniref:Glycosyl hydrolase-like 10 domain-containing protein n=1 Tax=Promicromonospora sukumoe TaxID=88382 RepID=A0A7W3PDY1_9MICO|nr:hypothetical protein [Promicromonospora sukumoe]MBA8808017.1 hypothetical protein [Promicromonospora sukumoe]